MSVRMEYTQDRLRAEIRTLEEEVADLKRQQGEIIVAEVVLAIICFFVGFAVGAWVT